VILFVTSVMRTTCIAAGTHLTYMFYVGESDGCGNGNPDAFFSTNPVPTKARALMSSIANVEARGLFQKVQFADHRAVLSTLVERCALKISVDDLG
jgi:hypothetical protein